MSKIVGGFTVSHDPLVFINPQNLDVAPIRQAYDEIRRRIAELRASVAIIVAADHYIVFGPRLLPQIVICGGEITGPVDALPGIPNQPIPHNENFARRVFDHILHADFDLAFSNGTGVDHGIGIPAHQCLPANGSVATVPVYMASGVEPFIPIRRAYRFGGALKTAIEEDPGDERVVLLGSGGISHWVGTGEMGKINTEFDTFVLDAITSGDPDPLLALSDQEIMSRGGNGAMEIRHFLAVMGAMPNARGEVIEYNPWKGGATGLGFTHIQAVV